ncbi:STAS domain-containing protein [uncultured Aquimarina sp.]|uniref:STAS domain-containing protein n=1 Tax=uncultured Aquimarina sp. TaxID=575652 RepID=UPI0026103407|nr:STAS domain-containing protein [uncultured Aquimarina sp.]
MKLQIQNKLGTFEVKGSFTLENTKKVKDHFDHLLDQYEEVVMCLKKVNTIDKSALQVLIYLHQKACRRSKILFVLGKGNRTVVNALKKNQLTYIFRNDY